MSTNVFNRFSTNNICFSLSAVVVFSYCSSGRRFFLLVDSVFFFSSRRRHTRLQGDWSSDVCSSDLRRGAHRLLFDVGAHLVGHVGACRDPQGSDRDDNGKDEGEEQLAIEACADFPEEGDRKSVV